MRTKDLRKLLRQHGCEPSPAKGSHEKWTTPGGHSTTLKAAAKDQAPGTLRNIQDALAPELGERWIEEAQK
ncbi:MAG: addiction module toxin, HicA family [Micromonosporaceae bacterium]|nr:addiction module toxin, HicA family [Micromonosporaceae bacterium]